MPTEETDLYRPQPTEEPVRTGHYIETDSILIDLNQGSMLEQHEHILATVTDEVNTTSHPNTSKELVSYEEEEEHQRSSQAPPIYMLDLSKIQQRGTLPDETQAQLSSLHYQGQHSPIEEKDHDYSSGADEDQVQKSSSSLHEEEYDEEYEEDQHSGAGGD